MELDTPANRDIARRLAEESIVLLANPSGALPLDTAAATRIAVIGPCADDPQAFFGCYAFPNDVIPQHPEFDGGIGIETVSLLSALRAELPAAEIDYVPGCEVSGGDAAGIQAAVDAATSADLVLLAVGDRAGLFGGGTSGDGCDVEDLALPGLQPQLTEALLGTGTPTVMITVFGRPYALGPYVGRLAGTVQAFFPGEEGGAAIAGVVSGRVNPSGKLPVGVPRHVGGQPYTYLAPPPGQNSAGVSNLDPLPVYWFGHGLSYTSYAYADLVLNGSEVDVAGSIEVSVSVTNSGDRDGTEVLSSTPATRSPSVTRPTTQLVGFARVSLAVGESATIVFEVHTDRLSFTGRDLSRIVEPGEIVFRVGTAGDTYTGPVSVRLTGQTRTITGARVMDTPVRVTR